MNLLSAGEVRSPFKKPFEKEGVEVLNSKSSTRRSFIFIKCLISKHKSSSSNISCRSYASQSSQPQGVFARRVLQMSIHMSTRQTTEPRSCWEAYQIELDCLVNIWKTQSESEMHFQDKAQCAANTTRLRVDRDRQNVLCVDIQKLNYEGYFSWFYRSVVVLYWIRKNDRQNRWPQCIATLHTLKFGTIVKYCNCFSMRVDWTESGFDSSSLKATLTKAWKFSISISISTKRKKFNSKNFILLILILSASEKQFCYVPCCISPVNPFSICTDDDFLLIFTSHSQEMCRCTSIGGGRHRHHITRDRDMIEKVSCLSLPSLLVDCFNRKFHSIGSFGFQLSAVNLYAN